MKNVQDASTLTMKHCTLVYLVYLVYFDGTLNFIMTSHRIHIYLSTSHFKGPSPCPLKHLSCAFKANFTLKNIPLYFRLVKMTNIN